MKITLRNKGKQTRLANLLIAVAAGSVVTAQAAIGTGYELVSFLMSSISFFLMLTILQSPKRYKGQYLSNECQSLLDSATEEELQRVFSSIE